MSGNLHTDINYHLLHGAVQPARGLPGFREGTQNSREEFQRVISELFGESVVVKPRSSDFIASAPVSNQGLPYILSGIARKQSSEFGRYVSTYPDPINAVLGTEFHSERIITIVETGFKGGQATVLPEHAQGKGITAVSKQRRVITQRIGTNFSMNMNLFLVPAEAKRQLDGITRYQRETMMSAIRKLAWETVFKNGTRIGDAMMTGDTTVNLKPTEIDKILYADQKVQSAILFSISKGRFGFENLISQLKQLNAYTPAGTARKRFELIVVPSGFMEYRKMQPASMLHWISGLPNSDAKMVEFKNGVYTMGDLKFMDYTPEPDAASSSTINPDVTSNCFESIITLSNYYIESDRNTYKSEETTEPCIVTNFETAEWSHLPEIEPKKENFDTLGLELPERDNFYYWWWRPNLNVKGQALVAVADPGPNTGNIVMQYPKLDIVTNASSEYIQGKYVVYVAAYLKKPGNVVVVPGARISGYIRGGGDSTNMWKHKYSAKDDLLAMCTKENPNDFKKLIHDKYFIAQCRYYGIYDQFWNQRQLRSNSEHLPPIPYRGTQATSDKKVKCSNNGALGKLDHPENVSVVRGDQMFCDVVQNYE